MKKNLKNSSLGRLLAAFSVLLLFLIFCSCHRVRDKYEIKADINGLDSYSKAYIQVLTDTGFCYIDSVNIQKTEVQFVGKLDEPTRVTLWIKDKSTLRLTPLCSPFYLDNSKITISGDIKSRGKIKVKGSDAEITWKKIEPATYRSVRCYNLYVKICSGGSPDSLETWRKQLDILREESKQKLIKAIKDNSSSYVALHTVLDNKSRFSYTDLKELMNCFPAEMHSSQSYKSLQMIVNNKPQVNIGENFKDFLMVDSAQHKFTRSQFKSKLLLIDFWASWCGGCRMQFKPLKEIYAHTKRSDFDIIGISLDEDPIRWKQALKYEKVPWANTLSPGRDWVLSNYLISIIPYNFLLDSNGKIIAKDLSMTEVDYYIKKYCN